MENSLIASAKSFPELVSSNRNTFPCFGAMVYKDFEIRFIEFKLFPVAAHGIHFP